MSTTYRVKTPSILPYLLGIFLFLAREEICALPFSESVDWSANNLALGGSSAALVGGLDGFLTNPATLAFYANRSAVGGSYHWGPSQTKSWSTTVLDGGEGVVGGFQFQWVDEGQPRRKTYSFAAAYPFPWAWAGASFNAYQMSQLAPEEGWHFSGTSGVYIPAYGGLSIGAYAKSLLDQEKDTTLPPSFHVGFTYLMPEVLRATGETSRRMKGANQDWNFQSGLDLLLKEYFSVRGGYRWNRSQEDSFWSLGATLSAPKMTLNFAYYQTKESSKRGYALEGMMHF